MAVAVRACLEEQEVLSDCDCTLLHIAGIVQHEDPVSAHVPDQVVERLERMAKREGVSVNAVAVRELAEASRRIDNAALLESLPTTT